MTSALSLRYMRCRYRDRLQTVVLATSAGTLAFAAATAPDGRRTSSA